MAKFSSHVPGRRMVTLPLPGDADAVLAVELQRAIRRDNQLNWREHQAQALAEICYKIRQKHPFWVCTRREPCYYCEELNDP
jgi:hypothetical protein